MVKISIVDDEKLMLQGFEHNIDWNRHGYKVVSLTTSGKSFLESCEKDCPDIAILDIQMPGLTGIELSRILKSKYPDIIIIILTSHEKFEFAREALQIKIDEFILKTEVEFYQILDILEKYRRQIECKKEKNRNKIFESFFVQLFNAYQNGCEKQRSQFICDKLEETDTEFFRKGFFAIKAYNNCVDADVLQKMGIQYFIKLSYNYYLLLCSCIDQQVDCRRMLCKDLRDAANGMLLGISSIHYSGSELVQSFSEAEAAYELHFYLNDPILFIEQSNPQIENKDKDIIKSMVSTITRNIEADNFDVSADKINELLSFFQSKRLYKSLVSKYLLDITFKTIERVVQSDGDIQEILGQPLFNPYDEIIKIRTFVQMQQWVNDRLYKLLDYMKNTQQGEYNNALIKEILHYINQNYTNDSISLVYVAEHFHISYVYLSRLFSKKTGMHFSDYLTNLRIEKARLLLGKNNLKSYEVAEMVGYSNPSYFAKIFKKAVGISPIVYQETIINGKNYQPEGG